MTESEHWHAVLLALRVPILVVDLASLVCIQANGAAAEVLGVAVSSVVGSHIADLSAPSQSSGASSSAACAHWATCRPDVVHVWPWSFQRGSGELVTIEVRLHVVAGAGGRALAVLELGDRSVETAAADPWPSLRLDHDELARGRRQRSAFLASVSHELRSPLHTIIGFAELLHDDRLEPGTIEQREAAADILEAGRRLLVMIDDVLELARVESRRIDLRPEPVALAALIDEVIASTAGLGQVGGISLTREDDPSLGSVTVDTRRFKQVLATYLANAVRFAPAAGRIVVRTIVEGPDWFRIEVEDGGLGIPADDLARVFAEVATVPGSRLARGTGFDLALARQLVEAQGGTVGARNRPQAGTVFHLRLPRRPAVTDQATS